MRYTVSEATKEHIDICVATRRIDLLALFVRHGDQLSPEVRGYLADAIKLLLSGELTFPKKRANFADWYVLAAQVRALERAGRKMQDTAAERVSEQTQLSKRVWAWLSKVDAKMRPLSRRSGRQRVARRKQMKQVSA
jgi:hypothetical protein